MRLPGEDHILAADTECFPYSPEVLRHCFLPVSPVKAEVHGSIISFADSTKPGGKPVPDDPRIFQHRIFQIGNIVCVFLQYMSVIFIFYPKTHLIYHPVNAFVICVIFEFSIPMTSKRQGTSLRFLSVR